MFRAKGAFTLFELVLVTLLLGIVYSLILGSGFKVKSNVKKGYPPFFLEKKEKKLIIYDNCSKIIRYTYEGNVTKGSLESTYENIKAYDVRDFEVKEFNDMLIENEMYDTCLVLERNENKIYKPLLLHVNDIFYFFSPFEGEIKSFSKLEEAKSFADVKPYMPYSKESFYNE